MKKILSFLAITIISLGTHNLFSFEKISTQELFYSYLKNDSNLKDLTIEAEKEESKEDDSEDIKKAEAEMRAKLKEVGLIIFLNVNM